MFHQPDLFGTVKSEHGASAQPLDLPGIIERISTVSPRPRYAFMVLNLIAKAARANGSAGPYVVENDQRILLRDWLCDALIPIARRDARRRSIVDEVRASLVARKALPADGEKAARLMDQEVRERVRRSGRCNVSRAVSDLVRAGLVRRHYHGFRVDPHNRGAQREAVYTITDVAASALAGRS